MKSLKILIVSFVLLVTASISNAQNDYSNSAWMQRALNGDFNKYSKNIIKNSKLPSFSVIGAAMPGCPTNWWDSKLDQDSDQKYQQLKRKLTPEVVKILRGFPQSTKEKCLDFKWIIDRGKVTDHHLNKYNASMTPVTILIGDLEGKDTPTPVLGMIETDYRWDLTFADVYNTDLVKICTSEFSSDTSANIDCGPLGTGIAQFKITNLSRGQFTLFSVTNKAKFFASNMPLKEIKCKYPEMFGLKKNSCSSTNNISSRP